MSKFLIYAALLLGMPTLTYLGFIGDVDGALYTVKFFVWAFFLPVGLLSLSDTLQKNVAKQPDDPAVLKLLWRGITWGCLGVMIWTGHIATGVAFAAYMLCGIIGSEGIKQHRAALSAALRKG